MVERLQINYIMQVLEIGRGGKSMRCRKRHVGQDWLRPRNNFIRPRREEELHSAFLVEPEGEWEVKQG